MPIKKVTSSMVWAVDYDAKRQILEAAFKKGGVFRYTGVPVVVYRAMMKSDSIGSYLRSCIIGMYPEARLDWYARNSEPTAARERRDRAAVSIRASLARRR